jgi:hypothetical protein
MVNQVCASFFLGPALIPSASLYCPFLPFVPLRGARVNECTDAHVPDHCSSQCSLLSSTYILAPFRWWATIINTMLGLCPLASSTPSCPFLRPSLLHLATRAAFHVRIFRSRLSAPTLQPAIVTAAKEPRTPSRTEVRMYLPDRVGAKSAWLSKYTYPVFLTL